MTVERELLPIGSATSLDLEPGVDIQAFSPILADYAGLTQAANKLPFFDSGSTAATTDLTAFARTLLDDANASAARTTLGTAIGSDVQAFDQGLSSIAGLTTSANKGIYATASDTYATFDLTAFGRSILDDADASAVRSTLGLVINTDVQSYNAQTATLEDCPTLMATSLLAMAAPSLLNLVQLLARLWVLVLLPLKQPTMLH